MDGEVRHLVGLLLGRDDLDYGQKLAEYRRLADEYFDVHAYRGFCEAHLRISGARVGGEPGDKAGLVGEDDGLDPVAQVELGQDPGHVGLPVPLGVALERYILPIMGNAAQTGVPSAFLNVYHPAEVVLLALAGLVIAVAGALAPAGWAAKTRTAFALRAE